MFSDTSNHGAVTFQGDLAYKLGEILCAIVLPKNLGIFKVLGYILEGYMMAFDCVFVYVGVCILVCNQIMYLVAWFFSSPSIYFRHFIMLLDIIN